MSNKLTLPFLETMITQACNLSCTGCSNYSDLTHSGWVSWAEGKQSLEEWLERIDILDFGILGGEPLMNPEVESWIVGLRTLLPAAQIRFTTNGLLLPKHRDIIKVLEDIGNCVFKITVHQTTDELEDIIKEIYESHQWEPVTEYGVARHRTQNNFRFHVRRPDVFVKTYQNNYEQMAPWNSNPAEAFEICTQQSCPLLYKGKIYKCSTSGLLEDTLTRVGNPNLDQWQKYITPGISTTSSVADIQAFIDNFAKPHPQCGQCPSAKHTDSILNHAQHIPIKKYQIRKHEHTK